jgi:dihydrolipoamide dehydrogenase
MRNEKPHNGYDLVVLGAGTAGYTAAIRAAQLGARAALIESREVGGTCLNRGCIPTKALIGSLEAMEKAKKAETFGFHAGEVVPDLRMMMERKRRIVSSLVQGVEKLLQGNRVRLFRGMGRLDSDRRVRVRVSDSVGDETVLDAKVVLLATGSEPSRPKIFPFDGKIVLTSDDILEISEIPKSLLIVGAGAIGVEFARIFQSLGSEIVLVEMMEQILPGMDGRIAQVLTASMKRKGIQIKTKTSVEKVEIRDGAVVSLLTGGDTVRTEKALICTGRTPNTQGIGLEARGIQSDKGFIRTDGFCRTNLPGVYAAGDAAGKRLLAYTAAAEGVRAVEHALEKDVSPEESVVPLTVFSDPEAATVGLCEREAIEKGMEIRVGRSMFAANGKAMSVDETEGFVALVAEKTSDRLVGGQVVGPHASELIAEIAMAIRLGACARDVAATLHSHPTLAETVMEAAHDVHGESIHKIRK